VAKSVADLVAVVKVKTIEVVAVPVMTVVKKIPEEPRKLSHDENIGGLKNKSAYKN
jgi:hypothetical protein